MPDYYEYKVIQVRESMIGNKMSSDKLEKLLNRACSPRLATQGDHGRGRQGTSRAGGHGGPTRHLRAPERLATPKTAQPGGAVPTKSSGQSTGGCSPGRLAAHPHPTGPCATQTAMTTFPRA
jgi:hypothetical protein